MIIARLKSLSECKMALVRKLNYLNKVGDVTFPDTLIDKVEELSRLLENSYLLLIKFSINKEIRILDNIKKTLIEAESVDNSALTEIRDILHNFLYGKYLIEQN